MTEVNVINEPRPTALTASRARQLTHQSSMRENVFEHMLLGQLGAELLARGVDYDELHSSVDKDGFDVLLEAGGILRHIQFKVKIRGGARGEVTVGTRLAARPSGCVVWLTYDPVERGFCEIRWFGDVPGKPLPALGDRVARHSRANSLGMKASRPEHRIVPASRFTLLHDTAHLADKLFGRLPADPLAFIRSRLRLQNADSSTWLHEVAAGNMNAIARDFAWDNATPFAEVFDGYRLVELISDDSPFDFLEQQRESFKANGAWLGDAITLLATFFLEVRADHFGANDFSSTVPHLNLLCTQLRQALIELEAAHA